MPSQSVLVIGGGLAGLSCAVALAEAGFCVRLLEKRPHLGGRATSYTLPDGSEVDNCQHVTLGCCTNLADFYRRAGAAGKIRFYERLPFADRWGGRSTIYAWPLPPPLHMAPSFLFFGALTLADKWGIARALLSIARAGGVPERIDGLSMLEWLHRMKQTPDAIARFWRVVLVSALDEDLGRTGARYGIDVFWKGFLANRHGYQIGIPSVPLAELYQGCCAVITQRGGSVNLRSAVRQIRMHENLFSRAVLDDDSEVLADACVAAVPYQALSRMIPTGFVQEEGPLAGLRHLESSPITGVHLWFDQVVMDEPFLALLDHTTQWIFNKSSLYQMNETESLGSRLTNQSDVVRAVNGQYLQLVISASYDLVQKPRQEIIDLCLRELSDVLPKSRTAQLRKATVIKEVNATFSPRPDVDRWRPAQKTGCKNLFLAGDWTQTGWPSTMEGAVRSGYLAAESFLVSCGDPRRFLQPDLPLEGFCKIWGKGKI